MSELLNYMGERKVIPIREKSYTGTMYIDGIQVTNIPVDVKGYDVKDLENVVELVKASKNLNVSSISYDKLKYKRDVKDTVITYVKDNWLDDDSWRYHTERKELLYSRIALLPELYQQIINMRYIEYDSRGELPLDDFVYGELCMSRSTYYGKKRDAMYHLGLSLLGDDV